MSSDIRGQRIRVALFLLVTTAVLSVLVILIGRSESMFGRKATLRTTFVNTSGLIAGASVRLAGVDVGVVHSIRIDPDPKFKRVDVELALGGDYLDRISTDSVAQISSKGLLGDMIIDITIGSADKPRLRDGDSIDSVEAAGVSTVIESVQSAIAKVDLLATDVDGRVREVLTPEVAADVGRITHSSAEVMEGVVHGKGLVHELIYEPSLAREAEQVVRDAQVIAVRVNAAVGEIERVVAEVKSGRGLLHGLVYDPGGGETVAELGRTSKEFADIVQQVQTGHGIVHSLVYDGDRSNLVKDLSEASRIVRKLAEETEEGKGTVGGLLKDPTIYEDLTTVLENIKRNNLLKALVRYTIVKDELKAPAKPSLRPSESGGR